MRYIWSCRYATSTLMKNRVFLLSKLKHQCECIYNSYYRNDSALRFGWFFLFYLVSTLWSSCRNRVHSDPCVTYTFFFWDNQLICSCWLQTGSYCFLRVRSCFSFDFIRGKIIDVSSRQILYFVNTLPSDFSLLTWNCANELQFTHNLFLEQTRSLYFTRIHFSMLRFVCERILN
jgi:hypothetical protein